MEQKTHTYYIIGEKTYVQREVTIGQANQLSKVMRSIVFPKDFSPISIFMAFGELLPKALAVVLLEEDRVGGKSSDEVKDYLKTRDTEQLASDLEWTSTPIQNMQVIEDFFDCNPADSLFRKFAGLIKMIKKRMEKEISSTSSVSPSPTATSPGEMMSSGASPSPNADRT